MPPRAAVWLTAVEPRWCPIAWCCDAIVKMPCRLAAAELRLSGVSPKAVGSCHQHHLVSGSRETVHTAGISVRGRVLPEHQVPADGLEDYVVTLGRSRPVRILGQTNDQKFRNGAARGISRLQRRGDAATGPRVSRPDREAAHRSSLFRSPGTAGGDRRVSAGGRQRTSGANLQPWHFTVVTAPELKKKIREAAEEQERHFYGHRASRNGSRRWPHSARISSSPISRSRRV